MHHLLLWDASCYGADGNCTGKLWTSNCLGPFPDCSVAPKLLRRHNEFFTERLSYRHGPPSLLLEKPEIPNTLHTFDFFCEDALSCRCDSTDSVKPHTCNDLSCRHMCIIMPLLDWHFQIRATLSCSSSLLFALLIWYTRQYKFICRLIDILASPSPCTTTVVLRSGVSP